MAAFTRGVTVGRSAHARILRVPFEQIPKSAEGQRRLLADLWREVDRFARGGAVEGG